jgi:two-component system NtrC family sensor kinase
LPQESIGRGKTLGNNDFRQTRKTILVRVLLLPFIIILIVFGILVYNFATYSSKQVRSELERVAMDHRTLILQFLAEKVADLTFISSSYSIDELKRTTSLTEIFRRLQSVSVAFFDLGVFDEKGNHLAYAGPYDLAGRNYAQTEWFKAVQEKGLYISDVFLGYRNIPHFVVAVSRNQGDHSWYLRATIDTFAFNDLVENIRIGSTGEAYLVNRKGILQSRRRSGGRLMEPDPDFETYQIEKEKINSFTTGNYFDRQYLYAAGELRSTGWIMVVRQAANDAYAPLRFSVMVSIIIIIGGVIVVIIMGYIQATRMVNSLNFADMEKQQMKTQLVIAGKLAEVGEMSTGLAHEINNPLQVMKSEITMIKDIIPDIEKIVRAHDPDPENLRLLTDSVEQIGIQIDRCGNITQGLLKFARKTDSSRQPIEMQEFIPEVVRMVEQRAYLENIRIIQELDPDIPPLMTDSNQLQQVFLNLLNNAIHALKGRMPAEIRIQCSKKGDDLIIKVMDNGCGISPEDMEKIYLPFFTTKPVGQGTGLGLSTVYGIVNGLGGEITVESEINNGTMFLIRLPLVTQDRTTEEGGKI